jgi:thiamine-monophosphate kinase
MAATPLGFLVTLALSEPWLERMNELADGIGDAAVLADTHVVGGDLTSARELSLGVTGLGSAATPLTRSGARPGDHVYVTGRLGGPLASLRAWRAGRAPEAGARERFAHPVPRLREARWLASHGAHAAIDISDGLTGDLGHILERSRVAAAVEYARIPRAAAFATLGNAELERDCVLSGGDDYELAFTAARESRAALEALGRELGLPLTRIGTIEAGAPRLTVLDARGEAMPYRGAYDHFRSPS